MKNRFRIRAAFLFATFAAVPLAASIAQAGSSPFVVSVQSLDTDTDGHLDRVNITFNQGMNTAEPAVATEPGGPGLSVAGYTILTPLQWSAPDGSPSQAPKTILAVPLAEKSAYDTDVTPLVAYVPGSGSRDLKTSLGNSLAAWDTPAADAAGAVLLGVTAKDYGANALFGHVGDEMWLRFTEPVSISGATPSDRWTALERAITFTVSGGTACQDGLGVITDRNFPRPQGTTDDPIISPAVGTRSDTIRVRYVAGNQPSTNTHLISGIPAGCKLGVHSDSAMRAGLTDAANTPAAPITLDARKLFVYPEDASLVTGVTADAVGTKDGLTDSIALSFDLPLDDSTIESNLGRFSVKVDGANVPITGFSTGANADDGTITLKLGETFPGGATSQVAYTRDPSCAATSSGSVGSGVKNLIFPLGTSHRACLGGFDVAAADGVSPVILSATTLDTDANGVVDGASLVLSEAITAGSINGWTIAGAPVTSFAFQGTSANLSVAEAGLGTGSSPAVAYTVPGTLPTTDAAGNSIATSSVQALDGAAPRLASVSVLDVNGDGNVDAGDFTFTEAVTPADGGASAFSLGGVAGDEISSVSGSTVRVTVPGLTGTAARVAAFDPANGAVTDAAGFEATQRSIASASVIDAAPPVASIQISPNAPVGPGTTTIRGNFSEVMDIATAPTVTFAGRAVTGAWKPSEDVWEGTIEIASGDCEVATGCEVAAVIGGAKDQRTNLQAAATTLATEIDTIAPVAPGTFAFEVTPSAPTDYANLTTKGLSLTFPVTPGDAAGGTAELTVDGATISGVSATPVDGTQDEATAAVVFDSASGFRAAVSEGAHQAGIRLCDDARNCTSVASAHAFTADYTGVPIQITTDFDDVVTGGTTEDVAWDGNELASDLTDVTIAYTTNGTTYTSIATAQGIDGTTTWNVPAAESATSAVRATTTDVAGNEVSYTTATFIIDSTAPVVNVTAPSTNSPFLGSVASVRWTATDASISKVSDPISIEYSLNNGASWSAINGGSYSHANDGVESWNVPNVKSLDVRVRVRAIDAGDRVSTAASGRIASGIRGFVAQRDGRVFGFGASSTSVRETMYSSKDVVRGIAVNANERSGYVLASDGRVWPYAETGFALPAKLSSTRFSGDLARGIAMQSDTRGYVVDAYGRIYSVGSASRATPSRTWVGKDYARGIILRKDNRGGYVLDKYGRLFPFKVGSYPYPRSIQASTLSSGRAVSVVLNGNERSGLVLEDTGRLRRFGGAPAVSNPYVSNGADAQSLVRISDTAGFWVDGAGTLRSYGTAYGAPSNLKLKSGWARAAG